MSAANRPPIADRDLRNPGGRSELWAVAMPTEHGGWGLTAEPVVLGLAVAPSVAGLCIGLATMLAFVARTPLRINLVDRHRKRDLGRTALARRVLLVEGTAIVGLVAAAAVTAPHSFWWPAIVAAPLIGTELWFDARSRSRRLVPELAGTVGICAVAAMVILAGGHSSTEACAAWLILSARAVTSIPHVRAQIARLHGRPTSVGTLFIADAVAVTSSAAAVVVDQSAAVGAVAVIVVVSLQWLTSSTSVAAKVVGIRQTFLGVLVVVATAIGFRLA